MRPMIWMGFGCVCLAAIGCTDQTDPVVSTPPVTVAENAVAENIVADGIATDRSSAEDSELVVPLEIKSWEEVQAWVAEQRGKVVVVDVWSTSCHPCLREFPHFVELHQRLGAQVACASLSVDFYGGEGNSPEDVRPEVLRFLTRQRGTMDNFISSDPDETVLARIGAGVIPVAMVYDREGQLHTAFNNDTAAYGPEGFSYADDIVPLVETLLAEAK